MSVEELYYAKLTKHISPGDPKRFRIFSTSMNWDWEKANPGFVDSREQQLVGFMPQPVGDKDKGPFFYRSSGQDIFGAYKIVLNTAMLAEIEEQLSIAKAKKKEESDIQKLNASRHHPDFDVINTLRKLDKTIDSLLKKIRQTGYSTDFIEAQEAIAKKKGHVQVYSGNDFSDVPQYMVSENGTEWATKVANGKGNRIKFSLLKPVNKRRARAILIFETAFQFIFACIFNTRVDVHDQPRAGEDDTAEVSIEFEALETITVQPNPAWFKSALLQKISQRKHWRKGHNTKDIFGPNGMHSYISGFVVAYHPSLVITEPKRNRVIDNAVKRLAQSTGLSIEPTLAGILSDGEPMEEYDERTNKITTRISTKSDNAQILGVLVSKPVADHKGARGMIAIAIPVVGICCLIFFLIFILSYLLL